MAARTFLTNQEFIEAKNSLLPPISKPSGLVYQDALFTPAKDFSAWLGLVVENRFQEIPGWHEAAPIAIGSWGRGELCPGSDLDVIFCGEESAIKNVVQSVVKLGVKFRSRVPEDPNDWTKNVDVLEVNALFHAKPFTQEAVEKLQEQKDKILTDQNTFRKDLLKAIINERKLRTKRYDSIANFLEPNLKFGAGGLRDLHQALILSNWFPERFVDESYCFKVLQYYKYFLLQIRHKLHLTNSHDILTAQDQIEISHWMGFANQLEFMVEVQRALSQVSFYSDFVNERCRLTKAQMDSYSRVSLKNWSDIFNKIVEDSSVHMQAIVRRKLYETKGLADEKLSREAKGQFLSDILDIHQDDKVTVGVFRSHIISQLIPTYSDVIGLVQHDQYHRYSVDAHLLQAVREVKKVYDRPKLLGRLEAQAKNLKEEDWNILRWAALYHDITKGQGGSHSETGSEQVLKDFKNFALPKSLADEVAWLVENHLVLSTAAFRKNPHSPQTWEYLFSRGVRGKKLYRLAIFTVIDIIATNPEAWNTWKANLMADLVETLTNPSRERYFEFSQKIKQKNLKVPTPFIESLDSFLIDNLSHQVLLKDFKEILAKKSLKPLVLRDKKNRVWVRFHTEKDERGLVLGYTQNLTNIGCNIRQAFIHTDPAMGVYDWFCVKTNKAIPILKKQLLHNILEAKQYDISFSQIDLVSIEESEWVFSFRAKDQKGLLLSAIQALYHNDLEIIWAKAHTWGRQIEDIFGVVPKKDESPEQILKNLKDQLEKPELQIL